MFRFEDYIGQVQAATAIAGLAAAEGKAPGIKDRKEIAAIQEVLLNQFPDASSLVCRCSCSNSVFFCDKN